MPNETSCPIIDPRVLSDPLARLTISHDELHRFLTDAFGQLGDLAGELAQRQECWDAEQREQDCSLLQRRQQLEAQRAELDDRWQKLEKRSLKALGEIGTAAQGESQIAELVTELSQQRSETQSTLEATQNQLSKLGEISQQLGETRGELSQTREDISKQREQLDLLSGPASSDTKEEVQQLGLEFQRERSAWEQERAVLETELDSVRNRAADLTETLEDHRRQLADQRSQWTSELKQMRQILEQLRQQPAGSSTPIEAAPKQVSAAAPPPENEPQDGGNDPVLDSVMAQFEMLQKDLTRRRKAQAAPK